MIESTPIEFPGLGITINPPVGFELFSLNINFYGVIIAVGLLLAVLYGTLRSKQFGIRRDDILDGVLWIVPFAVLCARLYYCAFQWEDFQDNPWGIITEFRKGGLAIYGGVIGAAIGVVVFCKFKKIKLPALLDLVALGFLIGQSLGRWGNFFNREAFGAETDSFLRMGLYTVTNADGDIFSSANGQLHYYHPTFLYESLWNLAGFLLLHFLSKRRKYDGQIALGYVAWYGLGRAIIEGLRTDSLYIPGSDTLRVSQLLAAVTCFAAVVVLVILSFRKHDPEKLYVNQIARQAAAELAKEEAAELISEMEANEEVEDVSCVIQEAENGADPEPEEDNP